MGWLDCFDKEHGGRPSPCAERMRKHILPRFGYEWIEELNGWCKNCEFDEDGVWLSGKLISDEDVENHHAWETTKLFFGALSG